MISSRTVTLEQVYENVAKFADAVVITAKFVSLAVDPLCDTSWNKTAAVGLCSWYGQISFVANSSFLPAQNLTLVASNGFSLQNNVVGSLSIRVNLQADYGAIVVSGSSSELYGNIVASTFHLTLTCNCD